MLFYITFTRVIHCNENTAKLKSFTSSTEYLQIKNINMLKLSCYWINITENIFQELFQMEEVQFCNQ
jgi:hypothetical protein